VDTPLAAQIAHGVAIHDAELQAEFVPHLVPPLDEKRCRADNQDAPGPVSDDEFQHGHPGLNGLAEAQVVGDQQVDPGHLDSPHHGIKLVVLDFDTGAEWSLDVLEVSGRGRTPSNGIEEGVESVGGIEARGVGQGNLLDDLGTRFEFPNDFQFLAQGVILNRR
jgi:hypothetical protein